MPAVSTLGPYPSLEDVMNLARALVNDTEAGATGTPGEGRTLTDDAPFTIPYINSSIQTVSRKLENNNVRTYTVDEFFMYPTAMPNVDPGMQCTISYTGYFDGTGNNPVPVLPSDLLVPLDLWERPFGSTLDFMPMTQVSPLPSVLQGPRFGVWEWRNQQICLLGCTQQMQLRLRYKSKVIPTFVPADLTTGFANIIVGITDVGDILALEIAKRYCVARSAALPPDLKEDLQVAYAQLILRCVRQQQRETFRREGYDSRDNYGIGSGNYANSFSGG